MTKEKHVIIGNGPAGMTAADTIRNLRRDDAEIVVLTEEAYPAYSRTLLPDYIAGRISLNRLLLKDESYYKEHRIELRLQVKVQSIRPDQKIVTTDGGESVSFDRLLIACGGKPKLPPVDGITSGSVFTLRTIDDARHIMASIRKGSSVIVLAQDLVGIEMTRAFCQMGMQVTYLEWDDDLLPHILDRATAEELAEKMKLAGVNLVIGEVVRGVAFDRGKVAVQTGSRTLHGDALAVEIGKKPELEWLHPSGIALNAGIVADERLRTNFTSIYVAGDAAEVYDPKTQRRKLLFGWKNALEQGRVAAMNMCGEMREFEVNYAPGLRQIFGVDVRHRWK